MVNVCSAIAIESKRKYVHVNAELQVAEPAVESCRIYTLALERYYVSTTVVSADLRCSNTESHLHKTSHTYQPWFLRHRSPYIDVPPYGRVVVIRFVNGLRMPWTPRHVGVPHK